ACRAGTADGCFARGHLYVAAGSEDDLEQAFEQYNRACEMGLGAGCFNAGVMRIEGQGVERNEVMALGYLQAGCRFRDTQACNAYGAMRAQGFGGMVDLQEAGLAFETACNMGDLAGCDNMGLILAEQAGNSVDKLKAAV